MLHGSIKIPRGNRNMTIVVYRNKKCSVRFAERPCAATQTDLIAFDQLRYQMLPYNYTVAWKITSERYTPMRALVMDFP